MLKKTAHFSRRWREETGGKPPSTVEVNQWIKKECVIIQKYKALFTARGMRCDIMALYWFPRKEVIFKVDERRKTIVTVLTGYTLHNTYRQREPTQDNMPFIRHLSGSRCHQNPREEQAEGRKEQEGFDLPSAFSLQPKQPKRRGVR